MLPPPHRLKQASDVILVRRQGRSWRHPLVILLIRRNEQETSRFAFVASRAVGKAVARNRAKRLLREAVRSHLPQIATGWDCLLIARSGLPQASLAEAKSAVSQLLTRAHLLSQSSF
ncbi:MAG: ribonuclease P protein component [Ardenticatenaceae bacterium]|nr:ribonuclease P protein component [Ardenticatenaceae bacterium]